MTDSDSERLAEIRKSFEYRTRYEGQEERRDEFLVRLLDDLARERDEAVAALKGAQLLLPLPMVSTLLRIVIQSFDAGGESMRSLRAQAIETVWHSITDTDNPAFLSSNVECDKDPWAFVQKARIASQKVECVAQPTPDPTTNLTHPPDGRNGIREPADRAHRPYTDAAQCGLGTRGGIYVW